MATDQTIFKQKYSATVTLDSKAWNRYGDYIESGSQHHEIKIDAETKTELQNKVDAIVSALLT